MEWLRKQRESQREREVLADTDRTLGEAHATIERHRRQLEVMTGQAVPDSFDDDRKADGGEGGSAGENGNDTNAREEPSNVVDR